MRAVTSDEPSAAHRARLAVWPGQKRFDAIIRFDKAVELEPIVHAAAMFVERRFEQPLRRVLRKRKRPVRQTLLRHMHAARRHHRPVDPRFDAREPDTRLDCAINDSQIVEDLQRARGDAERLAEETSRGHPVDHAHGDAVALQFGAKQQTDGTSADNQHIHVFHVPLLTVHRALKSNRGELSRKPKKNRRYGTAYQRKAAVNPLPRYSGELLAALPQTNSVALRRRIY